MRMYRCFLVVLMIAAIGFGVWYCTYTYNEQRSVKDGTLVLEENFKDMSLGKNTVETEGEMWNVTDECVY